MALQFKDVLSNVGNAAQQAYKGQQDFLAGKQQKAADLQDKRNRNAYKLQQLSKQGNGLQGIYDDAFSRVKHSSNPGLGDIMALNATQSAYLNAPGGPDSYKSKEQRQIESENREIDRQLWQANESYALGSDNPYERVQQRQRSKGRMPDGGFTTAGYGTMGTYDGNSSYATDVKTRNEEFDKQGSYDENGNPIYTLQGVNPENNDDIEDWSEYAARWMYEHPKVYNKYGDDFDAFRSDHSDENKALWLEYIHDPESQPYVDYILEDPRWINKETGEFDDDYYYDHAGWGRDRSKPGSAAAKNPNDWTAIESTDAVFQNDINSKIADLISKGYSMDGAFNIDADAMSSDADIDNLYNNFNIMVDSEGNPHIMGLNENVSFEDVMNREALRDALNQASFQEAVKLADQEGVEDVMRLNELQRFGQGWGADYRTGPTKGYEEVATPADFQIQNMNPYGWSPALIAGLVNAGQYSPGYTEYAFDRYNQDPRLYWMLRQAAES